MIFYPIRHLPDMCAIRSLPVKHASALILLLLIFCCCNPASRGPVGRSKHGSLSGIPLHSVQDFKIFGDFDGDGRSEVINAFLYSRRLHRRIDSAADPFQVSWDSVIAWFHQQDADLCIVLSAGRQDTLHLGPAQGLYCLINLGDTNGDGKDEVAFVVDRLDYSRLNSCQIYTGCDGKWTQRFRFGVHEGAFDWTGATAPDFADIPGFLERRDGSWLYADYPDDGYEDGADSFRRMKPLRIPACAGEIRLQTMGILQILPGISIVRRQNCCHYQYPTPRF